MSEDFSTLLEESISKLQVKAGTIINGTVIDVKKDLVIVNAGLKSEGMIPIDQFIGFDGKVEVQEGDTVEVTVDAIEDGFGETKLSIEKAEFKHGDYWTKLDYGIGARQYNQFDSDRGITSYPVQNYDAHENNQIEIWPIPTNDSVSSTKQGMLRFHGIKNLGGLINETDTADLDDQLIILYAAAEMLARQKQADSQNKLAQAQAHYARLKARLSKTETFVIGGGEPEGLYRPKSPPLIATTPSS